MTITTSIRPRELKAKSSRQPADKRTARAAAAVAQPGRRPAAELRAGSEVGHPFYGNQWIEGKTYGIDKQQKKWMSPQSIVELIDHNSPGVALNYRALHEAVGQDTYKLSLVKLDSLKFEEGSELLVNPDEAHSDKGAIVVDKNGMVIDGRHRSLDAKRKGYEYIQAYVPVKPDVSARRAVSQHPLEAAAGPLPGQIERVIVSLQNDGRLPIRIPPETMRHVAESLARYFQTASADKIEQFAEAARKAVEAELKTENVQTVQSLDEGTSGVNVGATPATSRGVLTSFIESATGDNIGGLMNMDFFNRIMREVTQGAGNFVAQNLDQTRLDEFPALELHRVYDREVPRGFKVGKGGAILPDPDMDWPSRWEAAGGELVDGRMVALKSDPIWKAIGDGEGGYADTLGNPFAPFAFNSGFDTDEVSRADAVALGLMDDEDEAKPADFDFKSLLNIEAASAAVSTQPGGQTLANGSRRAALGIQAAAGDVPLVVKCFITDADGRLLVLQADGYGRIDLPGGHLRAGETVEDGLRREVLEETGMTLTDVKELGTVLVPWNGQQPIVFFSAHADTDAPLALSDEHVDWFWLNRHEVALRNFSALTKPVANFMNGQPLEAGAPVATMALEAGDVEGHEFHGNQYTGKGGPPEKMDNKELRFRRDDAASAARMYPDEKEEHLKNHAILESEMKRRGMMTNVSSSIGHYRSDIGKKSKIR